MLFVAKGGKLCLPREILTVAQSAHRGLLLEVMSDQGNPYALLLKSGSGDYLHAVHKCYAVENGMACKHLRTAIYFAEQWLRTALPRRVQVELRWLNEAELIVSVDLTPRLLGKQGQFITLKQGEGVNVERLNKSIKTSPLPNLR